jgi:glutathione S-transferase
MAQPTLIGPTLIGPTLIGPTLIGSTTSPFVRKIRLAAASLSLPITFQPEFQWAPGTIVPEFNPLAKVPVLLTDDTQPLYDSRVIVAYLEQKAGLSLRPPNPLGDIDDMRIEALADGIADATFLVIVEGFRPEEQRSTYWLERQGLKISRGIAALASDLEAGRLPREQVTSGVIASVCALEFYSYRYPENSWRAAHPKLDAWNQIWQDLPLYAKTRPVPMAGVTMPVL